MSNPIYYIVSVSEYEEHIMAISFDKVILENMIREHPEKNEHYKLVIKENLKIFQIACGYDAIKQCDKYEIMYIYYSGKKYIYTDLYAYSRTKRINHGLDFVIEDGIIDLDCFYDEINEIPLLKNNISANRILFDTYYEEGVMNA